MVLAIGFAAPRPAAACKMPGNGGHRLDPKHADDKVAPSAPTIARSVAERYDVSLAKGCCTTCRDRAFLDIDLTATDDRTPPIELGYRVTLVGGQAPPGLEIDPEYGPATSAERQRSYLRFYYAPDAPDFEVELELRAVDLNGNEGPPVRVKIRDANGGTGGCSAAVGRTPWAAAALAMVVLGWTLRRRRRSSPAESPTVSAR